MITHCYVTMITHCYLTVITHCYEIVITSLGRASQLIGLLELSFVHNAVTD